MIEVFKRIPEYPDYFASNLGNIMSFRRYKSQGKILSAKKEKGGYLSVNITTNNWSKCKKVHRLVAMAWLNKIDGKNYINHKDYDPSNNKPENLEWCTIKENNAHRIINGRVNFSKGEDHYKSDLTIDTVLQIKEDVKTMRVKDVAKKHNLKPYRIQNIKRGITWSWLDK